MDTIKVSFSFCLSSAGQKQAILLGVDASNSQTRVIDVPADLIDMCSVDSKGNLSFRISSIHGFEYPADDVLVDIIRKRKEKDLKDETERKEAEAAQAKLDEKTIVTVREKLENSEIVYYSNNKEIKIDGETFLLGHYPYGQHAKFPPEIIELAKKKHEEGMKRAQAISDEKEAQKQAKKQAGIDALKAWANEHGSERLKLLISEGFEWEKVASEEWVDSICPEGFSRHFPSEYHDQDFDEKERTKPTLEELKALASIKELSKTLIYPFHRIELHWNSGKTLSVASLDLAIKSLNGETFWLYKFFPETEKPRD